VANDREDFQGVEQARFADSEVIELILENEAE
jgi:hypothetical protein